MIKFVTWLWYQKPQKHKFGPDKVNRWAEQVRSHLTIPHEIAVVTDDPDGVDDGIEIIPTPPEFVGLEPPGWTERKGAPQCMRRLALFAHRERFLEIFGVEQVVSMDMDVLIFGNMDDLFVHGHDFRIFKGTSRTRPYNGSMLQIRAGARPEVYERVLVDPKGEMKAARNEYLGSDQAVISNILGRGEAIWSEGEGVYGYSARLARTQIRSDKPPAGMRVLFFPGHTKPWDSDTSRFPWISAAWKGLPIQPRGNKLRLRAYRDPKGWGKEFTRAAADRGHFCSQFTKARAVHNGYAFVRLDQQGEERERSKQVLSELGARGIVTIPAPVEGIWYDDKGAQVDVLKPWLPRTRYIRNEEEAMGALYEMEGADYPFVSKAIDGSASKTVRLINSHAEAVEEVQKAFGPGIPSVYSRMQRDYVYWQDYIAGNDRDYRVVVVGDYVYGLVRLNRKDDFRASGSGEMYSLTLRDGDPRERIAAETCIQAANQIATKWMAFDVVFGHNDAPYILEMSSAWTMKAYRDCPCFTRDELEPTGRKGSESFLMAVEIMEQMWRQ